MLKSGDSVTVHGLCRGLNGKTGTVRQLALNQDKNAAITNGGFWTVRFEHPSGPLDKEIQRAYLRVVRPNRR